MRPLAMKRGSVRTQLIVGSILILSLLLIVFGLFVRTVVATTLVASADRDLANRAARLDHAPPQDHGPPPRSGTAFRDRFPPDGGQFGPDGGPPGTRFPFGPEGDGGPPPRPTDIGGPDGGGPRDGGDQNPDRPRLFDLLGHTLNPSDSIPALDPAGLKTAAQGTAVTRAVTVDGQPLRVLSVPQMREEGVHAVIQTAYPVDKINEAIQGVDIALLILIPFALVCAGFGGWFLTERVLFRVRQMAQAAGQIGAKDLSQRLPVMGSDEFSELADTFNALLGRVETAFQEQRRFIADASHELKTPLTVIRGTTSLALSSAARGVLDAQATREIDTAAASMSELVQNLLYLARADAGRLGRERIELPLVEPLQRAVSLVAPRCDFSIRWDGYDPSLIVTANAGELTRLFTNLLENAARHTPPDGTITVALGKTPRAAIVTIADTGVGIASEHLAHLCERFYRVDSARSRDEAGGGTGLGLAICKGIVDAHGGLLEISSVLGSGTTVTVTLLR